MWVGHVQENPEWLRVSGKRASPDILIGAGVGSFFSCRPSAYNKGLFFEILDERN
jgi:hypothetical protein